MGWLRIQMNCYLCYCYDPSSLVFQAQPRQPTQNRLRIKRSTPCRLQQLVKAMIKIGLLLCPNLSYFISVTASNGKPKPLDLVSMCQHIKRRGNVLEADRMIQIGHNRQPFMQSLVNNKSLNHVTHIIRYLFNMLDFQQILYQQNSMKSCCEKLNSKFCSDNGKYPTPYRFDFNGRDKTAANEQLFESNYVRTSKYTLLSFFPKALILQFKRLANVYFLLIAILQTIPQISPLSPATAWAPFIVVLFISLLREGYEDFQRIRSDRETNYSTMTKVMRNGKFQQVNWSKVVVGDIVMAQSDEMFPADLILISSSSDGAAFIQTASLDGQKNLKPRNSFKFLIPFNTEQKLSTIKGVYQGNEPDLDLHKFSSRMTIDGVINNEPILINGDKQLLYRGTRLKNTKWIYGLAFQTGKNTKIMMNSRSDGEKMSQIEKKVNLILVGILIVQVILSIVTAIGYSIFRRINQSSLTYINWPTYNVALDSTLIFFSYFVLINTMIPISLIVSIEVVKFFQMIFIEKDKLLYSNYRKRGVTVKSASLNEQLGQIEYVFSDKTGTLTLNIMQFKIAVIGKQMFGDISLIADNQNKVLSEEQKMSGFKDDKLKALLETGAGDRPLDSPIIIKDAQGRNQIKLTTLKQAAKQYIKALAVAHEVMPDEDKKGKKIYMGPSPDEITLVEGAKTMGYQFIKATQSDTTVNVLGKDTSYEQLEIFKFTSDRKRMSVIIKDNGVMKMYMKGADSIVEKRLAKDNKLTLQSELERFSVTGLRTLLIAMRTISEDEYKKFVSDRQNLKGMKAQQKQKALADLESQLESNMYVIGATAVLDRLQDEVPETIRDLMRANIKVWMLTGDKMETAENIARSCNLLQSDFEVFRFKPQKNTKPDVLAQSLRALVDKSQKLKEQQRPKGLLIQGEDLNPIMASEDASYELAQLAKNCEAVVCCRLLPAQKAQVVRLVRKYLNKITLAIGDGANDVPMIKQAHIGVGLYGEEGMGAVQASDYALPEFRMLWRVVLVHGRWNYIRISEMILYFFYKNMLFTLPQFYLAFYCGFSSQTVFDDWYVALYNLAFTSIPLIIRAVLEQDVNYVQKISRKNQDYENVPTIKTLVKQEQKLPAQFKTNKYLYRLFPKIYFIGQENCIFNLRNYLAWMAQAIIQSLIIFFFTIYILGNVSVNSTGINTDFWLISLTIYSSVILVVTFKLSTHTKFWSFLLVAAILITSIGFYILHMWLSNFALTDYVYGTTRVAWTSLECYFVVLLCVCIVLFVDGIIVFVDYNRGGYASRMREVIKQSKMNNREYYDNYSLTITDNVTTLSQKVNRKDVEISRFKSTLR